MTASTTPIGRGRNSRYRQGGAISRETAYSCGRQIHAGFLFRHFLRPSPQGDALFRRRLAAFPPSNMITKLFLSRLGCATLLSRSFPVARAPKSPMSPIPLWFTQANATTKITNLRQTVFIRLRHLGKSRRSRKRRTLFLDTCRPRKAAWATTCSRRSI